MRPHQPAHVAGHAGRHQAPHLLRGAQSAGAREAGMQSIARMHGAVEQGRRVA